MPSSADVSKHNTDQDCWVIVGEEVYDVTKFLPYHPGGKKAIMLYAGKDATEEFDSFGEEPVKLQKQAEIEFAELHWWREAHKSLKLRYYHELQTLKWGRLVERLVAARFFDLNAARLYMRQGLAPALAEV
jgi:cytochrome b involved in lipid metabolism